MAPASSGVTFNSSTRDVSKSSSDFRWSTMASLEIALYLTWLLLWREAQPTLQKLSSSSPVDQETGFVSATTGDRLTLQCSLKGELSTRLYWYKQTLGQKPRLISSYYIFDENGTFYDEFKDNPRFVLHNEKNNNNLEITELHISDSASYYCGSSYLFIFEFAEGVMVDVKGSGLNIPVSIFQSTSVTIRPGGSVTLNCTVQTGTCGGEHSVYWFKNSERSHPGFIYSRGGRSDLCERKPHTQAHTCVYNLPMKGLNVSHAGTYYCAVASCGHILFGNGTRLGVGDEVYWVLFWRGASTFTSILVVVLAFSLCIMKRRNNSLTSEARARCSPPSTGSTDGYQDAETLYYAALSANLPKRSGSQGDRTWSECLYCRLKK